MNVYYDENGNVIGGQSAGSTIYELRQEYNNPDMIDEDGNLQCKNLTNLKIKHVVNYQTGGVQTTEIEINALPDYKYWGIRKDDHEAVWNVYDYPITRFMYHTERSNGTVQQHMDTYNGLYYGIENYFSIGMTLDP